MITTIIFFFIFLTPCLGIATMLHSQGRDGCVNVWDVEAVLGSDGMDASLCINDIVTTALSHQNTSQHCALLH